MKLLLDIGNSSVNWAIQEHDDFTHYGAFSYKKDHFADDLQENIFLSETPNDVLVSNVAGEKVFNTLYSWVEKKWRKELWEASVTSNYKELKNSYADSQQMGVDRWLAMVACWEEYHTAVCLVGCGTALTIDLIDVEGQHLGGYIIPGIDLMQRVLVSKTEQINVNISNQASLDYAKDTQTAINNGAFMAAVSMINNVTNNFSKELPSEPKYILSGGMGELTKPFLNSPFEYRPNLVLSGLSIIYKSSL